MTFMIICMVMVAFGIIQGVSATIPSVLYIGGLFRAFDFQYNISNSKFYSKSIPLGILQASSFLMAIDQINNKTDGIMDDILPNTILKISIDMNQRSQATLNPSYFFDGGVASFQSVQNVLNDGYVPFTIVNGLNEESTVAAVETLNGWKVPSLIVQATSSQFSHAGKFPYNLRLIPSETYGAAKIYDVLKKHDWNRIALLFGTDTYGLDASATFTIAVANDHDITYLAYESYSQTTANHVELVQKLKASGATIFVLLLNDVATARFMLHAYRLGLLVSGSQVVGTGLSQSFDALITEGASTTEVIDILHGYINVKSSPELYYQHGDGQRFLASFRNLPPTKTVSSDGSIQCSTRRDDTTAADNSIFDYTSKDGTISSCLGIESYASFAADGSDLDPLVLYPYAAVQGYAKAIHTLITQNLPVVNPTEVLNYMNTPLLNDGHLTTVAGNFSFFQGIPSNDDFGKGDRFYGNIYQIQNFDSSKYIASGYDSSHAYHMIGTVDDVHGIALCDDTNFSFECDSAIYRNAYDNVIPADTKPDVYKMQPSSQRDTFIFFAALIMILSIASGVYFTYYRRMKCIHNAQYKVIMVTTSSLFIAGLRVLISGIDVDLTVCTARMWFEHISFRLMFGTLMLKLWRIHSIINTIGIKRVKITENDLMYYIFGHVVAVFLGVMIVTAAGGVSVGTLITTSANQSTIEFVCDYKMDVSVAGIMLFAIYLSETGYIVLGCYYLYLTRYVPSVINETKVLVPTMTWSIMIIVSSAAVIFAMRVNPVIHNNITTISFILISIPSTIFYVYHKFILIRREIAINLADGGMSKTVGVNVFSKTQAMTVTRTNDGDGRGVLSDDIDTEYNRAIEAMNQKTSFMEKVVFVQKHLDVWRAIYLRLGDEESSGNTSGRAPCSSKVVPSMAHMSSVSYQWTVGSPTHQLKHSSSKFQMQPGGSSSNQLNNRLMINPQLLENFRIAQVNEVEESNVTVENIELP